MVEKLLYVALDYDTPQEALTMAEELSEVEVEERVGFGFKLNGDLLLKYGMDVIDDFIDLGRPVLADLKLWKGRSTMKSILDSLLEKEVRATNVYAHASQEYLRPLTSKVKGEQLQLLALTVLTHYGEEDCQRLYGKSLAQSVLTLARIAWAGGCDGVILPPTALDIVKNEEGELFESLIKATPGIRPQWYKDKHDNYQKQVTTPAEAVSSGADVLVMGSPIRKSSHPKQALRRTLQEMEQPLSSS